MEVSGDTGAVLHGAREGRAVSLTFDDGPGRSTEEVLRVLDRHGERATFFMVGSQAERFPHIARRVVSAGHEGGSHTFSHLHHHMVAPPEAVSDIVARAEAVAGAGGVQPGLYRPPHRPLGAAAEA